MENHALRLRLYFMDTFNSITSIGINRHNQHDRTIGAIFFPVSIFILENMPFV